jgi:hypothetical protein
VTLHKEPFSDPTQRAVEWLYTNSRWVTLHKEPLVTLYKDSLIDPTQRAVEWPYKEPLSDLTQRATEWPYTKSRWVTLHKEPLSDLTQLVEFWKLRHWNCKTVSSFSGQNVLACGELHSFLTSALGGMEWSALRSGILNGDIRTPVTLWWTAEHVYMLRGNKFWLLPGIEKILLDQPTCSLVTILTGLTRIVTQHCKIVRLSEYYWFTFFTFVETVPSGPGHPHSRRF